MEENDMRSTYIILGIIGVLILIAVIRYIYRTIKQTGLVNLMYSTTIVLAVFFAIKNKTGLAIGMGVLFIVEAIVVAAIRAKRHRGYTTVRLTNMNNDIDNMEGHEFEYWCAALLRKNGYTHVVVTPGSGDQGVDITAYKDGESFAIQCKRFNSNLGNKPIQEVYAGKTIYGCTTAAVMTNSYFTPGALEAARKTGVLLWDRDTLEHMLTIANK